MNISSQLGLIRVLDPLDPSGTDPRRSLILLYSILSQFLWSLYPIINSITKNLQYFKYHLR